MAEYLHMLASRQIQYMPSIFAPIHFKVWFLFLRILCGYYKSYTNLFPLGSWKIMGETPNSYKLKEHSFAVEGLNQFVVFQFSDVPLHPVFNFRQHVLSNSFSYVSWLYFALELGSRRQFILLTDQHGLYKFVFCIEWI